MSDELARQQFDYLMQSGTALHNQGRYDEAFMRSLGAMGYVPEDSIEFGRASRDCAARLDRLGKYDYAEVFAEQAFNVHSAALTKSGPNNDESRYEAYRECAVSSLYLAVGGLRKVIAARLAGEEPNTSDINEALERSRQSVSDLKTSKSYVGSKHIVKLFVDQYDINTVRRASMIESLVGKRATGFRYAFKAVFLSAFSGSPRVDQANKNLKLSERVRAKNKALLGGIASLGVGMLSLSFTSRRPTIAFRAVNKTL